ncbi:F-box LRR-repeat 15 [Micractinium conductrix]|uniref:F-box LRR-repeat 15 n=1 Tax=Micractinium conductrix TaxID=554055 RepID=A0A2P6V042_9CHLO|nr:F-box LRR-repeat 15 [Micractinium conductrix]|eukprot:PSC67443.1 F-box LRR-repeat 15 [Micractinium conductrix]
MAESRGEHEGAGAEEAEYEAAAHAAAAGAVLEDPHLMTLVFAHLSLEDLCRVAMVRRCWREVTANPKFWQSINLKGRTLQVSKVRALLSRHCGVHELNARGVSFGPADLGAVLPELTKLRSLELEQERGYGRNELEAIGGNLPALTRLVLAGGTLMGPMAAAPGGANDWAVVRHPQLQRLELESLRAQRLKLVAPRLAHLRLRDVSSGVMQVVEGGCLAEVELWECGKLTDGALRGMLCLEGPAAAALPCLTSVTLSSVGHTSDETLRLLGQRQTTLRSLALAACGAVSGAGLATPGGFAELRSLSVEHCDLLTGANLSDAVRELHALAELRMVGCTQVTALRLSSCHLARLTLHGTRTLQELDLRCARLAEVDCVPINPGLASSLCLRRILLASHAVQRLQWSALPNLQTVRLQCPNLRELDLSECRALSDSVFESLGSGGFGGAPAGGYVAGDMLNPGCPELRVLKLGDCEALRHAVLRSPSLESLQLSQCRWLQSVKLDCPMLTQLALEECTHLEEVALESRRMISMSLGTCPRLGSIAISCGTMTQLDLRGCNQLQSLQLSCPALSSIDATFCKSLGDAAIGAMARCISLQELVLAACDSLSIGGLGALRQLTTLRRLDLSYTPLEDPTPIYRACAHLTSLVLSNNYALRPETLLPLFPAPPGEDSGSAALAPSLPSVACASASSLAPPATSRAAAQEPPLPGLQALDIGYCSMPAHVLAAVVLRAARLHVLSINGVRGGVTDALWPLLHLQAAARGTPRTPALPPPPPLACSTSGSDASAVVAAACALVGGAPAGAAATEAAAPEPSPPLLSHHALRTLCMIGSKELRSFCLGLVPADEALRLGLLISGGTVVANGRQYVPVATVLAGLHELRMSLSGRLRSLSLGLPHLEDLQLNNCAELAHLVLHCPALGRLALQGCRALPAAALLAVVASCPRLRELDLQYCPQATPGVVAALHAACPTLQSVLTTTPRAASP